ncbi:MAG: major tail protein [Flavonifractor plautii]
MADNKVKFGLKNVHYAVLTVGEDGAATYDTPVPIPGAVNLSLDAAGDTSTFYADNMAYFVTAANDGYSGTLEMAVIPDSFRKDVLGEVEDETDKVLVENSSVEGKNFAFLFEFAGDQKATRHVLYNCTATRPSMSSATTTNTKEPATDSLSLTASPLANGNVKAKTTSDHAHRLRRMVSIRSGNRAVPPHNGGQRI